LRSIRGGRFAAPAKLAAELGPGPAPLPRRSRANRGRQGAPGEGDVGAPEFSRGASPPELRNPTPKRTEESRRDCSGTARSTGREREEESATESSSLQ